MRGVWLLWLAGGRKAATGPAGVSTVVNRWRACSCGWCQSTCMSLTRALAIPA